MDPLLTEKLKRLRDYYWNDEGSLKQIDSYEKNVRKLVILEKLMENQSVIEIVKDAKNRVKTIDIILTTDKNLNETARLELFKEKEVHKFYLDRFDNVSIEQRMEAIYKVVDEEIASL